MRLCWKRWGKHKTVLRKGKPAVGTYVRTELSYWKYNRRKYKREEKEDKKHYWWCNGRRFVCGIENSCVEKSKDWHPSFITKWNNLTVPELEIFKHIYYILELTNYFVWMTIGKTHWLFFKIHEQRYNFTNTIMLYFTDN